MDNFSFGEFWHEIYKLPFFDVEMSFSIMCVSVAKKVDVAILDDHYKSNEKRRRRKIKKGTQRCKKNKDHKKHKKNTEQNQKEGESIKMKQYKLDEALIYNCFNLKR